MFVSKTHTEYPFLSPNNIHRPRLTQRSPSSIFHVTTCIPDAFILRTDLIPFRPRVPMVLLIGADPQIRLPVIQRITIFMINHQFLHRPKVQHLFMHRTAIRRPMIHNPPKRITMLTTTKRRIPVIPRKPLKILPIHPRIPPQLITLQNI